MRLVWLICGLVSLGLGFIGVVLPLIPTVPFILLAAFCFARSSKRLHSWLLNHKTFGPLITDWKRSGAIRPVAKKMATVSVAIVFFISIVVKVPQHVLFIQAVVLGCVMLFIWTRPNS